MTTGKKPESASERLNKQDSSNFSSVAPAPQLGNGGRPLYERYIDVQEPGTLQSRGIALGEKLGPYNGGPLVAAALRPGRQAAELAKDSAALGLVRQYVERNGVGALPLMGRASERAAATASNVIQPGFAKITRLN